MPTTYRVLGQLYPTSATETQLYLCSVIATIVSTLTFCNTSATVDYITVRICINGATDSSQQLLYNTVPLNGSSTLTTTIGITLANGDTVLVTSQNGTTAFQMFGQENS